MLNDVAVYAVLTLLSVLTTITLWKIIVWLACKWIKVDVPDKLVAPPLTPAKHLFLYEDAGTDHLSTLCVFAKSDRSYKEQIVVDEKFLLEKEHPEC